MTTQTELERLKTEMEAAWAARKAAYAAVRSAWVTAQVAWAAHQFGDTAVPITSLQPDGIHPSWKGYKEIAKETGL